MTYGDVDTIKKLLSVDEGETPEDVVIENALVIANAEIEGRLKKNLLKISGTHKVLDTVANYYGLAESLEPVYSNVDDENEKSKYYNSRADGLLDDYIIGLIEEQKKSSLNDNPYSVSTTNNGSTYGEILRD